MNQQSNTPQVNINIQQLSLAGMQSYFDGGHASYIGRSFLGALVTILTLGICFPWAVCKIYGWKVNHTVIEGRRLRFDGTAVSLFGQWIKWLLFSIITFGIYLFWVGIAGDESPRPKGRGIRPGEIENVGDANAGWKM